MKKILLSLIFAVVFSSSLFAWTKPQFVRELPADVNLTNAFDVFMDVPTASTSSVLNAVTISTTSLAAGTTTYALALGDYTDVILPRNVTVDVDFATGKATTTVSGTLTIIGKNQFGRSVNETIAVSTNTATGNVAFSTITSLVYTAFTITGASEDNILLTVGTGVKIGLSNNITSTANFIKVIEDGATSTTYVGNATYNTIQFASAPDGSKDYQVLYEARTDKTVYNY